MANTQNQGNPKRDEEGKFSSGSGSKSQSSQQKSSQKGDKDNRSSSNR